MDANGVLASCFDATANALRVSSAGDRFSISAAEFQLLTGPAVVTTNGVARIAYDAAATESAQAAFTVPATWASFVVDFYWSNEGAGAGAVRWQTNVKNLVNGDLTTEAAVTVAANVTAPAQNTIQRRDAHQSVTTTAEAIYALQVDRVGADAGDTLANDAALIAVRIRMAGV